MDRLITGSREDAMTPTGAGMGVQEFGSPDHRVIHGDALQALSLVDDESCALIFADPPYNIGKRYGSFVDRWDSDESYLSWCERWLELCLQKLTPNGSLYVMCSTQSMPLLDLSLRRRATILSRIVWHYDSSGVQARSYFGSMYEPILHAVRDPKNYIFNADDIKVEARTGATRKLIDYRKAVPTEYASTKVPGNVWYFARVRYRMPEYEEHPTQKPEALLERVIRASSNPGDTVLDPFSGSFTTSAVAKRLGRKSVGIDLNRDFVGIGLRRLELASSFDGSELTRPSKSTARRNGRDRLVTVPPIEEESTDE
jgi:adenine-specific DNA-methyltransferase